MSNRRNRPANRWGCKPTEDVCVQHDEPLTCPHGCERVAKHQCYREKVERDWLPECSGCTGKSWDSPEGRTHQGRTRQHPEY